MSDHDAGAGIELTQRYGTGVGRVYDAWTDPAQVKRWWGPKDFTAESFEADVRPGGAWHAVIVGGDGKPRGQGRRYTAVESNRLLAFTFRWEEPGAIETQVTVTFATDGDGTVVTFSQHPFRSDDERRSHEDGWRECLERSAAYVA